MAVATQKIIIHADDQTAAAIQSAIRNSKKLDAKLQQTGNVMRNTTRQGRAQMAQLGHQVQDVAVQYQMGMNPLMILGQQGSQVASVFGSKGPMIGAFIAIAAVMGQQLLPGLFEAAKSLEDLQKVNKEFKDSLYETADGVEVFSESLIKMARKDSVRAIIDLRKQVVDLKKNVQDSAKAIEDTGKELFSTWGYGVGESVQKIARQFQNMEQLAGKSLSFDNVIQATNRFSELRRFIGQVNKEFGFSKEASVDFSRAIFNLVSGKQGSIEELDSVLRQIASSMGDKLNPEAVEMIQKMMGITEVMKDSNENISVAQALIKTLSLGHTDLGKTVDETTESTKEQTQALKDQADYLRNSMNAISEYLKFREGYLTQDKALLKLEKDLAIAREQEDQRLIAAIQERIAAHKQEAEAKRLAAQMAVSSKIQSEQAERNKLLLEGRSATKKLADESARLIQVIGLGRSMDQWSSAEIDAYKIAIEKLNEQLFKVKEITPEVTKVTNEAKDAYFDAAKSLQSFTDNSLRSIEDGLVDIVTGTMSAKDAFKSMARSIIKDMIRMQIQSQYMPAISNFFSAGVGHVATANTYGTNIGSQQTSMLAAQDADFRAGGGPVSAGRPYIVGERGPELMIPNSSGTVIPNHNLSGGDNVTVNLNISTGVPETVRTELMSMLPQIQEVAKTAVMNAKARGMG